MPQVDSTPKTLRPYTFHGVDLDWRNSSKEAIGDCPFCGRDGKFSVNLESGKYRCVVDCVKGGNATIFLRELHEKLTDEEGLVELAEDRKALSVDSLLAWGIRRSNMTRDFIIPGYGADRNLVQLYRVYFDERSGKWEMRPTPEQGHGIFGANLYEDSKENVDVCEGPWDGIAWWETIRSAKNGDVTGKLSVTGVEASSLYAHTNVLAIPGCGAAGESLKRWVSYFQGKNVRWLGDSDHPKLLCKPCKKSWSVVQHKVCPNCETELKGNEIAPAGFAALKRATSVLLEASTPPKEINFLRWGEGGYDPGLKSGYDIRDRLSLGKSYGERVTELQALLNMVEPIPDDWLNGKALGNGREAPALEPIPCDNWKDLIDCWKKAKRWNDGADVCLSVICSSIVSVPHLGDQIWFIIQGPPSSLKSTLSEAVSKNETYVLAKSNLTGFHSGFKTDKGGEEDHSLVSMMFGKTLVVKDADPLLKNANRQSIMAELRDIYDCVSRTQYRHGIARVYEGLRTTIILFGTGAMRELDVEAELGARFLTCCIMDKIDSKFEDEISTLVIDRTIENMHMETLENSTEDPKTLEAMRMTSGFIDFLRGNSSALYSRVEVSPSQRLRVSQYAKFIALMRARPSLKQVEVVEREMSPRLSIQLTRLAMSLAVVLGRYKVDKEVMRRVRKVAMDTCKGRVLRMTAKLHEIGKTGVEMVGLARKMALTDNETILLLRFLRAIEVCEDFRVKSKGLSGEVVKWRLTDPMRKLFTEVMKNG